MADSGASKRKRRDLAHDTLSISNFITILSQEDPDNKVLTEKVLPSRSSKRTRSEQPSTDELISINDKFKSFGYDPQTAISDLQTDLKLAAQSVISKLSPASEFYASVDKFYFYAESLFARQIETSSASTPSLDNVESAESSDEIRVRGNDKEVLYMVSQHGPLFSSLSKKSRIDPREFDVPSIFNTTKIVPLRPLTSTNRKLGLLSPSPYHAAIGRAPVVTANLQPLLSDFTHPVNEKLPTAKWLRYDAYSSFAPSRDEGHVIVSGRTAAAVWYDRIARKRAVQAAAAAAAVAVVPEAESEPATSPRPESAPESASESVPESAPESVPEQTPEVEPKEDQDMTAIDPELIKEWLGSEASKDYEAEAIANITTWLSRLQTLQSSRYTSAAPSAPLVIPPHVFQNPQQLMQMQLQQAQLQQYLIDGPAVSDEERELATKLQTAFAEIVAQIPPYLVSDLVSGLIPTLSQSTAGSLPPDTTDLPTVPAPPSGRRRR
ncbi:hypothetical protein V1512DRAFT_234128 [Lipomyces arxii]|uniref:uncharacterized protein n=1 Tax=Lipomyces arxii TaxID=56418 RepID=UPI0034CECC4C